MFQAGTTANGTSLPLQRLSLTGGRTLCYPTQFPRAGGFVGGYRESAAGTELVFGTQNGLEVVANDGQPIRALAIRGADGCDLLVKGAYAPSRLRQMIFGGATRHILANATLPVLMAH